MQNLLAPILGVPDHRPLICTVLLFYLVNNFSQIKHHVLAAGRVFYHRQATQRTGKDGVVAEASDESI